MMAGFLFFVLPVPRAARSDTPRSGRPRARRWRGRARPSKEPLAARRVKGGQKVAGYVLGGTGAGGLAFLHLPIAPAARDQARAASLRVSQRSRGIAAGAGRFPQ